MRRSDRSFTTTVETRHLGGRIYEAAVAPNCRLVQVPRACIVTRDEEEVTLDNAGDFDLRFVPREIHDRLLLLFGADYCSEHSFNEVLERAVATAEAALQVPASA